MGDNFLYKKFSFFVFSLFFDVSTLLPDKWKTNFNFSAKDADVKHMSLAIEVPDARKAASTRTLVIAATIGSALEFFDFTAYSFFAIVIGKLFFPSLSPYMQLLMSVTTYGVGYVIRPVGGLIFGSIADTYGRKKAMTATVLLMAAGCAVIGFAPTYAQVGGFAPLIIVVGRALQGLSAGGEVGTATTILVESASPNRRGLLGSLSFASQGLGVVMGGLVAFAINHNLSNSEIESWGWRVPFYCGVCIAFVALALRTRMAEAEGQPHHDSGVLTNATATARSPVLDAFKHHFPSICFGVLLIIGSTVCANIVTFYMPTYAISVLHMAPSNALAAAIVSGVVVCVASIGAGILSDRFGRKTVILYARIGLIVALYPAFRWISLDPTPVNLMVAVAVLSTFSALTTAPSITMIPEMFPRSLRASGMSVVYSVGVSVFGGFAQTSAVWLIHVTGSTLAPAYYTMICVAVSTLSLLFIRDKTRQPI
ncbi:MFS transporter [Paraburkholderia susongensis]|uniref:Predicted arabinose efflux permease, MFS family n=1 Tax=Paraburkholderia susongensis TaxID=1515439 RepID=A0A1X7LMK5_9BURK|nr:MFS transporter [Paraburkholderia susongensis]SMG54910.1 Predicted arabinose efflux permease, MFS family [Paraburkholderia susongensis]